MKSKFLALAIATVALNLFAPAVGHAQDYIVNGHNASKAEAQFLASYSAPAGHWQVDGYGISRVGGRKCWYVLRSPRGSADTNRHSASAVPHAFCLLVPAKVGKMQR